MRHRMAPLFHQGEVMTLAISLCSASLIAAAVSVALIAAFSSPAILTPYLRYVSWWNSRAEFNRLHPRYRRLPLTQIAASSVLSIAAIWSHNLIPAGVALAVLIVPAWLLSRAFERRLLLLTDQLDETLTALANALRTMPNLGDALSYLKKHLEPPMGEEIGDVMAEVRLGRPLDEALTSLACRLDIPGLHAAVAAAIMGRKTGGDLSGILEETARSIREMARLEGVIRTKTAEGRSQALVMGLIPPFLTVALHKIDPTWLEPLWHDPIGWILLGIAAMLEISAVALIRKIMAVDI